MFEFVFSSEKAPARAEQCNCIEYTYAELDIRFFLERYPSEAHTKERE